MIAKEDNILLNMQIKNNNETSSNTIFILKTLLNNS